MLWIFLEICIFVQIIKCDFDEEKSVDTKLSYADLVTKTDKAVEEMVFSTVKEAYPAHKWVIFQPWFIYGILLSG